MADSASAPAPAPATGRGRPASAAPGPIELADEKTVQTLATPDEYTGVPAFAVPTVPQTAPARPSAFAPRRRRRRRRVARTRRRRACRA